MAITNIGNQLSQQFLLKILREQVNEASREASTGKKSTTIANMGATGASQSISLRSKFNLFDDYTANLNAAKSRFQIIDNSLGTVAEASRDMASSLRAMLQSTDPQATLMSDKAKTLLQNVTDKLNIQFGGRFLFSGDDLYSASFNNAPALDTNMAALVSGWMTGGTTPDAVALDARAVSGNDIGISDAAINAGSVSLRVDDTTDIDYTIKANQSGFPDILRGLSIIANLPQPTTPAEQDTYWNVVNGALKLLDDGAKAIDNTQGLLGTRAKIVDDLTAQHRDTKAAYEQFIGDVEDVDMAEAALRLQSLTTQLQSSLTVISQSSKLSLANFI